MRLRHFLAIVSLGVPCFFRMAAAAECPADMVSIACGQDIPDRRLRRFQKIPFAGCRRRDLQESRLCSATQNFARMFANCFLIRSTPQWIIGLMRRQKRYVCGDRRYSAMWLRDSSHRCAVSESCLPRRKSTSYDRGLIRRQLKCILLDPYANAFNDGPTGGMWMSDMTDMRPELHERKWEIDSLVIRSSCLCLLEDDG